MGCLKKHVREYFRVIRCFKYISVSFSYIFHNEVMTRVILAIFNSVKGMVADKIKIEKIPTSSVEKTNVLIGFSVVELPKNSLQMLDSGKF